MHAYDKQGAYALFEMPKAAFLSAEKLVKTKAAGCSLGALTNSSTKRMAPAIIIQNAAKMLNPCTVLVGSEHSIPDNTSTTAGHGSKVIDLSLAFM